MIPLQSLGNYDSGSSRVMYSSKDFNLFGK